MNLKLIAEGLRMIADGLCEKETAKKADIKDKPAKGKAKEEKTKKTPSPFKEVDVINAIRDAVKASSKPKVIELIKSFGVETAQKIPPENMPDFMGKLKEIADVS